MLHLGGLGHSALGAYPQGHQPHSHPHHIGPSWANSDTYYEGRPGRGQPLGGIGPGGPGSPYGPSMPQPPPGSPPTGGAPQTGSDILDSQNSEPKLDKSNILLLGPTGLVSKAYCFKWKGVFRIALKMNFVSYLNFQIW